MNEGSIVAAVIPLVILGVLLIMVVALYLGRKSYFAWKERRVTWGRRYRLELLDPKRPDESLFNYGKNPIGIAVRDEFSAIDMFRQSTGCAHHILEGEIAGRSAKVFDYQFVTGSGRNSTTHFYSVVCFYLPRPLPHFELRPHTFWDKVTALFGARDVQIGDPEFDKHFRVTTDNPGWLQSVMVSGIDDVTLSEQQTSWHCLGDRLIVIAKGTADESRLDGLVHANLQFVQQAESY